MTTKRSRRRKSRNSRVASFNQVSAALDELGIAKVRYRLHKIGERFAVRQLPRTMAGPPTFDGGAITCAQASIEFFNDEASAKSFIRWCTVTDIIEAALRAKP